MTGEPWEVGQRGTFRLRFGEDVDAYDATRPVAPDVVFDGIVERAGLHAGSTVVEIGPGTGQATRGLAARGLQVLAVEIDARIAARAVTNLEEFPQVSVHTTSFEHWDPGEQRFDAVVAFNSWHWVDPSVGMAKAAAVLNPHGHLVVVTTPVVVPDGASRFWTEVQDDWVAAGAERLDPATRHPDLVEDGAAAIRGGGLFEDAAVTRHPFSITFSADEYVRNLSTQSGVKQLADTARAQLLERIERRVHDHGDRVVVHHLAVVTIAEVRS